MSWDADAPGTAGPPRPTDALPPVPLTDDQLAPLADHDAIGAVYVPDGRPEDVYTLEGDHEGDILEFYVETADCDYVAFRYTMAPNDRGLAWVRHDRIPLDHWLADAIAAELDERYCRLEVNA